MDDSLVETAPRWALRFAAGSAALAVLSFLFGGPGTELLTGALVAAFLAVSGYILYRSRRDEGPPGGGNEGGGRTRQSETTAETGANGYGGDGGDL